MPKKSKQLAPIQFRPSKELDERLEKLAKQADMSKSRLVQNIIEEVSKDLESCGKVGILQFAAVLRNMSETLSEWAQKVKKKKIEPL